MAAHLTAVSVCMKLAYSSLLCAKPETVNSSNRIDKSFLIFLGLNDGWMEYSIEENVKVKASG